MALTRQPKKSSSMLLTLWMCLVFAISGFMQFIPPAGLHHHHEAAEALTHAHCHHLHDLCKLLDPGRANPTEPCCLAANPLAPLTESVSLNTGRRICSERNMAAYGLAADCISGTPPPKLDVLSIYADACGLLGAETCPDRTIVLLI